MNFPSLPFKSFAEPADGHVSLGRAIRAMIFVIPVGILAAIVLPTINPKAPNPAPIVFLVATAVVWGIIVSGIRVAAQWERGVVLRLGRFSSVKGPGILFIIPFLDYVRFIDTRILTLNIPNQKVITKAEGDKIAAINLAHAAATMFQSPGAMQLRTLQTVDGLGPSPSNTVVLFPVDLIEAFRRLVDKALPTEKAQ